MMSILGAAWRRLEATFSPDSTVNSAATRLSTVWLQRLERVGEALAAVLGQGQGVDAGDLGDDRVGELLVGDELAGVGARADAHAVVVAEDRRARGERRRELAVDVDDDDAGVHGLGGDLGEGGAVGREQDDRVDLVVDEGLDLRDLQARVVRALGGLELDVRELLGLGLGGAVDGGEPAVVGGRAGEADGDLVAGLVVVAAGALAVRGRRALVLGGVARAPGGDEGDDAEGRGDADGAGRWCDGSWWSLLGLWCEVGEGSGGAGVVPWMPGVGSAARCCAGERRAAAAGGRRRR